MNPDHLGTPSRDVANRVCSTTTVAGDSWSHPSDESSEGNSSFLHTLDHFLEEYETLLKGSSTSSTEHSINPLVADDDAHGVLYSADFLTSAHQNSDIGCGRLDTLPLGSSHCDITDISKLKQAPHWISKENEDDFVPSICSRNAPLDFDHPPNSPKAEDSQKCALENDRQPFNISAVLQVTQANKSSPFIRFSNQNSVEDISRGAENSNDNPHSDLPLTTPAQADGRAPLPRFPNEASDKDCLGASKSYQYSTDCHLDLNHKGGMAPLLGYCQFNGKHLGLPTVDSKEHEAASVEDVPQFTTAYFHDAFHTWDDSENCQGVPSKIQTLSPSAAHEPYSTGSASSIAELPASSNKNESANTSSKQNHSYRHSPVFSTKISDSSNQDGTNTESESSALVHDELSEPEAHTEDIEHSATEEDDNVVLLVGDEPEIIGGWTPAASTAMEQQDSPARSVKYTDTLVISVENHARTAIAENSPEQYKTLVISDSPAAGHDPQEDMSMAVASHQIKMPLKKTMEPRSIHSFDLRERINNIRSRRATHATGGSSIESKSYCSNAHYTAEVECSKQQASSWFTIPHLHNLPSCSSKVASSFRALDFEQTSQKPHTSAAAASRRGPFLSQDPEENNDNANPEWERFRRLTTDEERYGAVRNVWHNSTIPNPHCNVTTFHYRRQALRAQGIHNTPAPKQHKRKASHSPGSLTPAKRQHMDTDVLDLKLQVLERNRDHDFLKSQRDFERDLGELRSSAHQNQWQSDFEQGSGSRHCKHRRANTVPCDFRYYLQEKKRLHAQFEAEQDTIHHKYRAAENKLLSAREEVKSFDKFYVGLQQADPRRLTDEQLRDQLNIEELMEHFSLCYSNAKD